MKNDSKVHFPGNTRPRIYQIRRHPPMSPKKVTLGGQHSVFKLSSADITGKHPVVSVCSKHILISPHTELKGIFTHK